MPERLGFIHEELDIKILILYILRRLPGTAGPTELSDLVGMCDEGFGYFDYSQCLTELIDNGLVSESAEGMRITEKGAKNVEVVETDIPFSVRRRADRLLKPVRDRMRRDAMIKTSHVNKRNGCFVELAMSDGEGDVIRLRLLCGGEEQAKKIEQNFRKSAEAYYQRFVELLSE